MDLVLFNNAMVSNKKRMFKIGQLEPKLAFTDLVDI